MRSLGELSNGIELGFAKTGAGATYQKHQVNAGSNTHVHLFKQPQKSSGRRINLVEYFNFCNAW
jgi:hypothetical protein